ncbi:energy-coupling factor transporter transmembrane component T [Vagococcus vulneris]|uniref:Cobalt ABC transporter permease n=1 Tax=Vagococcus vulneris TaxID=1977869 RepID=A0A429ZZ37_9ENTE|nr:energy-coupling factor transporter transmembrane component T [Vagococcus vulneris]RST99272.1 cobalt ABC transporter permease [Vagococcus vulneris]
MKSTNSLTISLLILILTLEISFSQSIMLNICIIASALVYLLINKKWRGIILMIVLPIIPAIGSFWSIYLHGNNLEQAFLLFSRTFAFAAMGMTFAFGVDLEELLLYLEQKKISPNFIYGILVVIHAMPEITQEVKSIQESSKMRGKSLHFWSPMLYLKVIVVALSWRDSYTEAMFSRGFDENGNRRAENKFYLNRLGAVTALCLFIGFNVILFL